MSDKVSSGPLVCADQVWAARREPMERIIRCFTKPIRALEIGTWFGAGSTQIWLDNLPANSSLTLVDSWRPYASPTDLARRAFYAEMDARTLEAYLATILAVRRFESENREKNIEVTTIRGNAASVCSKFRSDTFDFIFIDGSHYYNDVKADIREAKRIAKSSSSIICGDDLELMPSPEIVEVARQFIDHDWAGTFHPGVALAVHEEFKAVNMTDGFWWIYKKNGQFTLS